MEEQQTQKEVHITADYWNKWKKVAEYILLTDDEKVILLKLRKEYLAANKFVAELTIHSEGSICNATPDDGGKLNCSLEVKDNVMDRWLDEVARAKRAAEVLHPHTRTPTPHYYAVPHAVAVLLTVAGIAWVLAPVVYFFFR